MNSRKQTYQDTLEFLFNLKGKNKSLSKFQEFTESYGNPQLAYKTIHIAGTNGKGTVAACLSSILQEAGYRVGLFTSPHLHDYSERIRVNSQPIEKTYIIDFINKLKEEIKFDFGFFEITTFLAFSYFRDMKVDIAIIEAGIGGRKDVTNIINPELTIITSVDYDHRATLGLSIRDITLEKAGIIKSGVALITGELSWRAKELIHRKAYEQEASLFGLGSAFFVKNHDLKKFEVEASSFYRKYFKSIKNLELDLIGEHQIQNAAIAAVAAQFFSGVTNSKIQMGLKKVRKLLSGRLELIRNNQGAVLFDVCHNSAGSEKFVKAVKKYLNEYAEIHIIVAIMKDKDYERMLLNFLELTDKITFTQLNKERALKIESIQEEISSKLKFVPIQEIEKYSKGLQKKEVLLCFVGSFYLIDIARRFYVDQS